MEITTIIENEQSEEHPNLEIESGLSFYVQLEQKTLLFDTGFSEKMLFNAKALGLDLKRVDLCIISHGHSDHTGGLEKFLELNDKAQIYLHKEAFLPHYAKMGPFKMDVGLSPSLLKKYQDRIHLITKDTKICEEITLLCNIEHKYPLFKSNKKLYRMKDGELQRDDFNHEIITIIEEKQKAIAFTGCSHSGVRNMIETIQTRLPNLKLNALFGGFHLMTFPFIKWSMTGSKKDVCNIGRTLQNLFEGKLYTGHCTGTRAFKHLKSVLQDQLEYLATGETVVLCSQTKENRSK